MPASGESFDATSAIEACPVVGWEDRLWRMHKQKYAATDPGGAVRVSGRYNLGLDLFPEGQSFGALYLSTAAEICLGEITRHLTPELLPYLNDYRLSTLFARLEAVLDCRDPSPMDLTPDDLTFDTDYDLTQKIGAAAFAGGLEGLLVPSATGLGNNLIAFVDNLRPDSLIEATSSRDPRLYRGG